MEKITYLFEQNETARDMAKFLLGGTSTIIIAKFATLTCLVFTICIILALLIVNYVGFAMINRK